jgi:hypothetical protein
LPGLRPFVHAGGSNQRPAAQLEEHASRGVTNISVVDAHSYWIDGYFEETEKLKGGAAHKVAAKPIAAGLVKARDRRKVRGQVVQGRLQRFVTSRYRQTGGRGAIGERSCSAAS